MDVTTMDRSGVCAMGAFYDSICLPGAVGDRVRETVDRWLALRGFVPVDEPMLFDLDGELERNVFVVSNARWTVVIFSKFEEERRLIREFQGWSDQVIYVWVQDSDTWGYDLFDPAGYFSSFASDPRSHQSFAEEPMGDAGRPSRGVEPVSQWLGIPDKAAQLRRLERRSALFEEDICLEFCRLLGLEAAVVSYDDLERGSVQALEGWTLDQWLYRHRDATAEAVPSLAEFSYGEDAVGTSLGHQSATDIIPELHREMAEVRRRSRNRWLLLAPVAWVARLWRRLRGEPSAPLESLQQKGTGDAEGRRTLRHGTKGAGAESGLLANRRHRCQIVLASGVQAEDVSGRPSAVFAFRVGKTQVTCTARRRELLPQVLQRPHRSKILEDEGYGIRGLKARHVLFELPPLYLAGTREPSFLGLHVVEAPQALYVFLYRMPDRPDPETAARIHETVRTFRILDDPPPGTGS